MLPTYTHYITLHYIRRPVLGSYFVVCSKIHNICAYCSRSLVSSPKNIDGFRLNLVLVVGSNVS